MSRAKSILPATRDMRRPGSGSWQPRRALYSVELLAGCEAYRRSDVEDLVAGCPCAPSSIFFGRAGSLAARVFFYQRFEVLQAIVFFWSRRLDGGHQLTPVARPLFNDTSLRDDVSARLKALFAARARELLEGEAVLRCQKKIDAISEEIQNLKKSSVKHRLWLTTPDFGKVQGLDVERKQIEKKLEEFRAMMRYIVALLEGTGLEGDELQESMQLFGFLSDLDWGKIYHRMMRECRRLDEGLPIYGHRREILQRMLCQQAMMLIGETGSGKSTQLVQFLADMGLDADGCILCTQPRKIAAISLTERVRAESIGCYEENSVICYPTYSSAQRFISKVIFMTDNCLLQHLISNMDLNGVSYIIVDEVHERSLNTDLLLGLLKKILLQRSDLRLIIMSATADESKLSQYFFGCEVFHVKGRSFPVEIKYVPNLHAECPTPCAPKHFRGNHAPYVFDTIKIVGDINKTEEDGDILAFLTSQMEVEWACENFHDSSAVVLPLHGKLSCEEQARVFKCFFGKRKVIFSTNLAETSLTIPGVKYVVDSGMVKECRFEPKSGINVLRVCNISQSSANQRAGRAGRTAPGKCYRIYSEHDFQSMPSHFEPEIRRVNLGIAVLRILSLGIKDLHDFDFVDAPNQEAIELAIRNLISLGAIASKKGILELTDAGQCLVRLGIEPRHGKLIMDSYHHGLGREGLVLAAVMDNASSIFCRVGTDEEKLKSDCLKVPFCHSDGDLFTFLFVYKEWEDQPPRSKSEWCWKNSINAKTMRRCNEAVTDLEHCLQNELNIIVPSYWLWNPLRPSSYDVLLKEVILSSHKENLAVYSGYDRLGYEVALTGQHAKLHPSCSLQIYGQSPSWVVFGELLSISTLYLTCVTAINYECLPRMQHLLPNDVSSLKGRIMQSHVLTGLGSNLLKRFCGKSNSSLHRLTAHIQTDCKDSRIGIDVDFGKKEIRLFATSKDIPKACRLIYDALEHEKKMLRDECYEKCLFRGGPEFPPVALFGAGAEIKHLELDKRYLSVEISHPNARSSDEKELLLIVDQNISGLANFYRSGGIGQESEDSEKWGKMTFLSPESAEKALVTLNQLELDGFPLKANPYRISYGSEHKMLPFPVITAKVFWSRRQSKGVAIIKCAVEDRDFIYGEWLELIIKGKYVHRERGREMDCIVLRGIDVDILEPELADILRSTTSRRIKNVLLLRNEAVNEPSLNACVDALLRKICSFMPSKNLTGSNCRVHVFPPEPRDYTMKALVTFDGTLHLEAAKALEHIEGTVLPGCLPWQIIQCQRLFHTFVSCPAPIYYIIKKELDSLLKRLNRNRGVFVNLEKNNNGSYRVKVSSNATKIVAELRKPLEDLMRGRTVAHPDLTPRVLQLLLSREGVMLMKNLQRETGTYILHDRHNMNVRVFGPLDSVNVAERKLLESLMALYDNKQLEVNLRGENLPKNLIKEVIQRFGSDLNGLKEKVPGADFVLDTRRHILYIRGSKKLKQKVEDIIFEVAKSVSDMPSAESGRVATCSICLCEVEDGYTLEGCGHEFCRMCLIDQCESMIRSRNGFPLCCVYAGCKSKILLVDLRSLLTPDKVEELFKASLGAFVASSGGVYRFCPSPDCPGVYRAADPDSVEPPSYACGACFVETCRKCHMEYHRFVSCEKYREFKDDPDTSLMEWRKEKDNVKNCNCCGYTIEKGDGCNHIQCKCGKHICWVCLESFQSSDDCYAHLRNVHQAIA